MSACLGICRCVAVSLLVPSFLRFGASLSLFGRDEQSCLLEASDHGFLFSIRIITSSRLLACNLFPSCSFCCSCSCSNQRCCFECCCLSCPRCLLRLARRKTQSRIERWRFFLVSKFSNLHHGGDESWQETDFWIWVGNRDRPILNLTKINTAKATTNGLT